jgi:hypothetical protein
VGMMLIWQSAGRTELQSWNEVSQVANLRQKDQVTGRSAGKTFDRMFVASSLPIGLQVLKSLQTLLQSIELRSRALMKR